MQQIASKDSEIGASVLVAMVVAVGLVAVVGFLSSAPFPVVVVAVGLVAVVGFAAFWVVAVVALVAVVGFLLSALFRVVVVAVGLAAFLVSAMGFLPSSSTF